MSLPEETISVVRLSEVATITDSLHSTPAYSLYGYPMVRVTDVRDFYLETEASLKVSKEIFNEFTRRETPRQGDIVFTRVGSYGNSCLTLQDKNFCLGQNTALIRPHIDPHYLLFCLKSPFVKEQIESSVVGSTQKTISIKSIKDLLIPIHSTEEIVSISQTLSSLQSKIELNRKTNETLEAMAKALFKSWFVDFDPVRAKAEGRPTGLPAEISDLFPDSFEDSELGEIPSGWAIETIENIAEVIDCLHSKKPEQQEVGKQLLQLNNIEDNGLLNQSQKYIISADDYANWSSRIEVEQGDCVITNVGRVGAVAQIPKGVKAAMGRNMTAIRTKGIFPYPTFLLEYLLSAFGREEIRLNIDEGTILNALNVKNIPRLRFFGSPDSILNAYEKSARPLREAMECSLKENQSLSALRDALLPKLISGEIRIPDAEKMLEEVGV
jgi:type I restriction enzyme, S subunit